MNKVHINGKRFFAPAITAIAASFTLSTAFAANLPKNCTDEIVGISKGSGFDIQKFTSDLPTAVAKAKLQAKAPFGKPKDSDKTDIGMTFGCLKVFPESPSEIQSLLKDVSQEMAKDAVASQLGAGQEAPQQAQYQPQQYAQPYYPPPPQAQPQYQYPPPPQYQYPPLLVQCKQEKETICKCECSQPPTKNYKPPTQDFTGGQRFATWLLNIIIPIGLGSALIMNDYAGMGIQIGVNGLGTLIGSGTDKPEYLIAALCGSFIYNTARTITYEKPRNKYMDRYSSSNYSGFNLAVLPNKRGEAMPYVMYNKTF
jgi:hypothetical protein